uniref:UL43 protein n=1 Tax=Anatid alphaherpesvirus 2 TaxID=3080522 RepID=A0AAU0K7E8_9ALPH
MAELSSSLNDSELGPPPDYTPGDGRGSSRSKSGLSCISSKPCSTLDEHDQPGACWRCVAMLAADLILVGAHLGVTVASVSTLCKIGDSDAHIGCAIFSTLTSVMVLVLRFSSQFSEILAFLSKVTQLISVFMATVSISVLSGYQTTGGGKQTSPMNNALRILLVVALATCSMSGALVFAYHCMCFGSGGDVLWRLGLLATIGGTMIGIAAPFSEVSPLVGVTAVYVILLVHVIRDSGLGIRCTCFYIKARIDSMNTRAPMGRATVHSCERESGHVSEDEAGCSIIIKKSIVPLTYSYLLLTTLPSVFLVEEYMSSTSSDYLSLTLEACGGLAVGLLVSLAFPSSMDRRTSLTLRAMIFGVLILGAVFALCGLPIGTVVYSLGVAMMVSFAINMIRVAFRGVQLLAATVIIRTIIGYAMLAISACAMIVWYMVRIGDLPRPEKAGGKING